jgi:hypothetical protein
MTPAQKRERTILRRRDIYLRQLCCQPGASKSAVSALVEFEVYKGDRLRELEELFDVAEATYTLTVTE